MNRSQLIHGYHLEEFDDTLSYLWLAYRKKGIKGVIRYLVSRSDRMSHTQVCNECGRSVAPGSGRWVNRIPDGNTLKQRVEMGKPFPQGQYMCEECESEFYEQAEKDGEYCHKCGYLDPDHAPNTCAG